MPVYNGWRFGNESSTVRRKLTFGEGQPPPPPPGARDALLQPYATSSHVNQPIGSGATRGSSGLSLPTDGGGKLKTDPIYLSTGIGGEEKVLTPINFFFNRTKGTDGVLQADGTYKHTVTAPSIPANLKVKVTSDWLWGGIMNGLCVAPGSSGRYVYGGQALYRKTVADNPGIAFYGIRGVDIYGDGRPASTTNHQGHGGSGLPIFGMTLRAGEWNSTQSPQHVLALNINGKYLSATTPNGTLVTSTSTSAEKDSGGWKEPADRADGGYWDSSSNNYYSGSNTTMKLGTLLALPTNYNFTTNSITDADALRLGWTLKNFGIRIVDVTGIVDTFAISVESTIATSIANKATAFHTQMLKMIKDCEVITNDTLGQFGGPGTRLVDPPPELGTPPA